MFATRIPTKSASFQEPNAIVSAPKATRIPFGTVSVFARTMLRYERLERWAEGLPCATRRLLASASVSPPTPVPATSTIHGRYPGLAALRDPPVAVYAFRCSQRMPRCISA
jgi:hypothetical protein